MSKKKNNIDYLRDIIEKNMPEANKDEAIEFLDEIYKELDDWSFDVKTAEDERDEWKEKYNNLSKENIQLNSEFEDYFPSNTLQFQMLNEAFVKFVSINGPLHAERILDELNKAPYLQAL
jgi:hypothetical protein